MELDQELPLTSSKSENRWARWARRRLPILEWAPRYSRLAALGDAVAGVTLGLTLVPQSIAYAALADLPVQYGLYSAFVGTILYMFLGTVKEVSIGPTSLMALLTLQACRGLPVEFVVLLTFLSGCVVLLMGLLRLGFLVELISVSVTSGFTSATAVIIVASQLKGALGLSFTAETVVDNLRQIVARRHQVRAADCALAAVCCTTLLLLRKLKDVKVRSARARKALWLVSIARNALVVLAASVFAYCTYDPDHLLVKLSGRVEPGLPTLALPPFSAQVGDRTEGFVEMARRLGPTLVMMPVVMVIANIAIAKAFTAGGRVDATQEMVTLGLCNCAGALLRAMPTTGAFTRSAVAHSSGVRTPAAGLYAGIITILALIFMTEYFYFIPKACLSSVLICAVIFMVDYQTVSRLWRQSKSELAVLAGTFAVSACATVELGVLAGVLADLALLVRSLMQPHANLHVIKTECGEAVMFQPTVGLVYVNVERVLARAARAAAARAPAPLLLDCARLALLDAAAEQALERLAKKLEESKQQLIPYNASAEVARRLQRLRHVEARALLAAAPAAALRAARLPPAAAPAAPAAARLPPAAAPAAPAAARLPPAAAPAAPAAARLPPAADAAPLLRAADVAV